MELGSMKCSWKLCFLFLCLSALFSSSAAVTNPRDGMFAFLRPSSSLRPSPRCRTSDCGCSLLSPFPPCCRADPSSSALVSLQHTSSWMESGCWWVARFSPSSVGSRKISSALQETISSLTRVVNATRKKSQMDCRNCTLEPCSGSWELGTHTLKKKVLGDVCSGEGANLFSENGIFTTVDFVEFCCEGSW